MKTFDYKEQTFGYEDDKGNGVEWKVVDIIEHTKHIKPVLVDVSLFKGFLDYTVKNYNADDWLRVKNADTNYPILMGSGKFSFSDDPTKGSYPYIFDGVHRLVKLQKAGVKKVMAVITDTLPPPKVYGKGLQLNDIRYDMPKTGMLQQKLYHGTEQKVDTLKPMGINMGNRFEKPHWATYFWGSFEKAKKWAIYQYFRRVHKQSLIYHIDSGGFIVTKQQYDQLKKLVGSGYTYVYEAILDKKDIGFGSSSEIEEYTVKREVTPYVRQDIRVDLGALDYAAVVASQSQIDSYVKDLQKGKYKLERGLVMYLLLDSDKDVERHKYMKRIKDGTLKPGDSLEGLEEPPSSRWR